MTKAKTAPVKVRRKRSHPTQQDIAKALGLGQSTVATALNPEQRHRLQEATVERVLRCAKQMGYRSGQFAPVPQAEQRGGTGGRPVIAIVAQVGGEVDALRLFNMMVNDFNRYDVDLLPAMWQWFDNSSERLWRYLSGHKLSGVVLFNLVSRSEAESIRRMIPSNVPVVALKCTLDDVVNLKSNIEEIFLRMTSLHLAAGAKRLGLLLSPRDHGVMIPFGWTQHSRVKGFMSALHHVGGQVVGEPAEVVELLELSGLRLSAQGAAEGCVGTVYYFESFKGIGSLHEHGYRVACNLIENGTLPEVMFCGNDAIAFGFLCGCIERGVRVPEDVALCGCNGSDWTRFSPIALSTITGSDEAVATEVARLIMDLVEGRADASVIYEKYFPLQIVLRESSGDLAKLRAALMKLPPPYSKSFVFESGADARLRGGR